MSVRLTTKTINDAATKKMPDTQAWLDWVTANSRRFEKYGVKRKPATQLKIGNNSETRPKNPFKIRGKPIRMMLFS